MSEEWRAIDEYPGYSVSSLGNVTRDGKPVTQHVYAHGYMRVFVTNQHGRKSISVHSLVLTAFAGSRPIGYQARHLNGIRYDNRIQNLKWGTPKENYQDKILHGTTRDLKGDWTVRLHEDKRRIGEIFKKKKAEQKAQLKPVSIIELVVYDTTSATGLSWKVDVGSRAKKGEKAGSLGGRGYFQVLHKRKNYSNHRLIWELHNGAIPTGMRVMHSNGIGTDNRIENLRLEKK